MNDEILDEPKREYKDNDTLTTEEVMQFLKIQDQHPRIIYRLRSMKKSQSKHLKSFKVGNQVRFTFKDVLDWRERNVSHFLTALSAYGDDDAESWFEPY